MQPTTTDAIDMTTDVMEPVIFTKITENNIRSAKASAVIPFYKLIARTIKVPKIKMFTMCPKILINSAKNN